MSILRNAVYTSTGQIAGVALTFASSIVLARWLGPENRGVYAIVIASVGLLAILGNMGLQPAFIYLTGKRRYQANELGGHVILFAAGSILVLAVFISLFPRDSITTALGGLSPNMIWLALGLAVAPIVSGMVNGILLGLDRIGLMVRVQVSLQILAALLLVGLLIVLDLGLKGALYQLFISSILAVAANLWILHREAGISFRPNLGLMREALGFGLKLHPGNIGYSLMNRIDLFFVNYFAGPASAGLYAVAVGLAEKLWIVDQAASQAVMPQVTSQEAHQASEVTSRAFRASFWTVLLLAAVAGVLSPLFIPFLYGEEFRQSVPAFVFLMPGVVALSSRVISPFFSLQMGRPEIPTFYGLAVGAISVPIYYYSTLRLGYIGAALATSGTYILLGGITLVLFMVFSRQTAQRIFLPTRDDLLVLPNLLRRTLAHVHPRSKGP